MRNEVNNHTHKKGVIAQKVIILILSLIILVFLITPILVNALKGKDLLPEFVHREMKTLKYNLEGAANVYLPLLLDLSIGTLDWKKDTIMLYAADSDSSDRFNEYFLNAEKRVKFIKISVLDLLLFRLDHVTKLVFAEKNFGNYQFFKLDKLITDSDNLMVVAYGWLYRPKADLYSEYKVYQLSFKMDSGRLLLKDFFEK